MGFTGDDRNGVVFQTGTQIHRINQYAVSSLYNSIVQQVMRPLSNLTACLNHTWVVCIVRSCILPRCTCLNPSAMNNAFKKAESNLMNAAIFLVLNAPTNGLPIPSKWRVVVLSFLSTDHVIMIWTSAVDHA